MLVVGGVPVTLLGTGEAGDATGFDHCADKAQVRCGLAGHDAAGRVADLGAVKAEANAAHHLPHVVLSEIGVGTTRTAGGTIEALVDAAQHGVAIEASRLWMQLKDLVKGHVSPFVRAAATHAAELSRRLERYETSHVDTRDSPNLHKDHDHTVSGILSEKTRNFDSAAAEPLATHSANGTAAKTAQSHS
jgi:hypothetical protein